MRSAPNTPIGGSAPSRCPDDWFYRLAAIEHVTQKNARKDAGAFEAIVCVRPDLAGLISVADLLERHLTQAGHHIFGQILQHLADRVFGQGD